MRSRKRNGPRALSDLERVVMGIVWKRGPCTPYVIRKEFATSPSSHWRGSTGAIYPLVRRLAAGGYLKLERTRQGRRPAVLCHATARGASEIRRWLQPPLPAEAASITYDPLRTRMPYLGALTPAERRAFLEDAVARLEAEIPALEKRLAWSEALEDDFAILSVKGALKVLAARIEWMNGLQGEQAMRQPRLRQGAISATKRGTISAE